VVSMGQVVFNKREELLEFENSWGLLMGLAEIVESQTFGPPFYSEGDRGWSVHFLVV
jgi:hypothetical protein